MNDMISRRRPAAGHFEPVQFLFDLMERVVADLVVGPHDEHRLPRGLEGATVELAVCRMCGTTVSSIQLLLGQMRRELLSDGLRHRRVVVGEARQSRSQGAFARRLHFATDRIIVIQVECA
jgi:hypothetical protein